MEWFYDYIADIYKYTNDAVDEYGVSVDGYMKDTSIECDIQPTGIEKIKKTYGYDIEANYEMYSDENLNESDIVSWNNETYKIQKIIKWDDYCISLLKQEDVKLNG